MHRAAVGDLQQPRALSGIEAAAQHDGALDAVDHSLRGLAGFAVGGVNPGVTKDEALSVLEDAAAKAGGSDIIVDYAGESRQIRREGSALVVTLGFSVILIYLVLAAQFSSFRDPLIVLLGSVPLAISGALLFSFLDLTTINIYSQVGLITLVGLIAKNGILIVEFANGLQRQGRAKMEQFFGGKVDHLPMRDPLTLEPIAD